ncbi:tetratricopeptide repeat-containing sulfotransferase family protein [Microbulbifer variabilis]|uniref:tetratricopeptide repeat-containing sulfotransferase family protein n=1 Tax=Microbulbifer variabilis TaxID=266805 RepID=UPI0003665001|nr:sulfotransferase [Microbulbifer variabilis]
MTKPQASFSELQQSKKLINKHQYTAAEAKLLRVLEDSDNNLKTLALEELYKLTLRLGRKDKALDHLFSLASIKKNDTSYWAEAYKLAQSQGYNDKAIQALNYYIQQTPECSPNIVYNLAYHLKIENRLSESLSFYKKALSKGISNPEEVYTNIGVIYSELRQEDKAKDSYQLALNKNREYTPALLNLAALFEEQGDKQKATKIYHEALKVDPKCSLALARLSYMYHADSIQDPRINNIRKALDSGRLSNLNMEELNFALGKLLDDCHQYDAAFKTYCEANALGAQRIPPYDPKLQEWQTNTLKDVFFKDNSIPEGSGNSSITPIFICGMFRSGSTLLEQILSGHSQVSPGGEIKFIPEQVKKMGSLYPPILKTKKQDFFNSLSKLYIKELKRPVPIEKYITDKRPDNFLHIGLIKKIFPKAKIVWTTRNFLDNCLSIFFQQMGPDFNYSVNLEHIAHYYSEHIDLMDHWKNLFPNDIYEINYENLVTNSEITTRELLRFLELPWESSCLDFSQRKNYVKTASIWQVRNPLYSTSMGRNNYYSKHLKILNKYKS